MGARKGFVRARKLVFEKHGMNIKLIHLCLNVHGLLLFFVLFCFGIRRILTVRLTWISWI